MTESTTWAPNKGDVEDRLNKIEALHTALSLLSEERMEWKNWNAMAGLAELAREELSCLRVELDLGEDEPEQPFGNLCACAAMKKLQEMNITE